MISSSLAWALGIAVIGGVVRGTTGFGGAMVMTPALSLTLGPLHAVISVLMLEAFAAAPMLPAAARIATWRALMPISLAACVTIPVGGYLLVSAEPGLLRRCIAATVIVFALILMTGFRYAGRQRLGTSVAVGAVSGVLVGATSVGGPPVILYLLSGPEPAKVTRANLTLYIAFVSVAALAMMWARGIVDADSLLTALALAPPFYAGVWLGGHLFGRISEAVFRRWTLIFLVVISSVILVA
jgi:uncharacterized membrane protein YfcA